MCFVWCEELSRSRRLPWPLIFSSIGIILHIIISLIQLLIIGLEQKILNFREEIWKDNQRERNNWDILIAVFYFILIIYLFLLVFLSTTFCFFALEEFAHVVTKMCNLRFFSLQLCKWCLIVNFKNVLKD